MTKSEISSETDLTTSLLLPKIVRSTKLILGARSFFFSYDVNLTRRLAEMGPGEIQNITRDNLNPLVGALLLPSNQLADGRSFSGMPS